VYQKFVKVLQFVFFLTIGLILLYYAFRDIDLNELMLQIKQADYRWVALSLVFATLALVFRAFRWQLLIEPLDEHPKRTNIFHAINIGYLANFVFPRMGEIVRCGILNRTDHVAAGSLFGTVIVERIFDVLMVVLTLCIILLFRFHMVVDFMMEQMIQPLINNLQGMMHLGWPLAFIALTILIFLFCMWIFRKKLSKISVIQKFKDLIQGVFTGIQSARRMRSFGLFMLLNILVFVMYALQSYVMFFSLESTTSLGFVDALFILAISSLAMIVPVQGGIGAYHWIVSMGLTIYGLTREEGMVFATISHSVTSILFILLGAVSLFFVFFGSRSKKKNV